MADGGAPCAFCGASRTLVETGVLDEKWSRRFGGAPAVALDHGWYLASDGRRVAADRLGSAKTFSPAVRACCDYCVHGWIEDLRWRAEPTLLALAEGRRLPPSPTADLGAVVRWTQLTAMLAELVPGMPTAASSTQRHAVREGRPTTPGTSTWVSALAQRLPARIHLSQVSASVHGDQPDARMPEGIIQIVSLDVAHFSALVVIPSDEHAREVVETSALAVELGPPYEQGAPSPRQVDLARTPHPHQIAVQRLCASSSAVH